MLFAKHECGINCHSSGASIKAAIQSVVSKSQDSLETCVPNYITVENERFYVNITCQKSDKKDECTIYSIELYADHGLQKNQLGTGETITKAISQVRQKTKAILIPIKEKQKQDIELKRQQDKELMDEMRRRYEAIQGIAVRRES